MHTHNIRQAREIVRSLRATQDCAKRRAFDLSPEAFSRFAHSNWTVADRIARDLCLKPGTPCARVAKDENYYFDYETGEYVEDLYPTVPNEEDIDDFFNSEPDSNPEDGEAPLDWSEWADSPDNPDNMFPEEPELEPLVGYDPQSGIYVLPEDLLVEEDMSLDPAYVEGTYEYEERIAAETAQRLADDVEFEAALEREKWDELTPKELEIFGAQYEIDQQYGEDSDVQVIDIVDGVPILQDSRGVQFIETYDEVAGMWRLEEKGSRTIGKPVSRPPALPANKKQGTPQTGKPNPHSLKQLWEEYGEAVIGVAVPGAGPVIASGKVGIQVGKAAIGTVSKVIDTAVGGLKWTAIVSAILLILFVGTALYFGYKMLNSGVSAVSSLAERADPDKLLNTGLMAYGPTRAIGVGSELLRQTKDSRVMHDARCVCDACAGPDAFERKEAAVTADSFYVTPTTTSSLVHLPEGEYGRTYLDERPFRVEISARATIERQRLALVHELLHVYDEVHKLGITHDQLHGLSYYILSEVMPGIAKLEDVAG